MLAFQVSVPFRFVHGCGKLTAMARPELHPSKRVALADLVKLTHEVGAPVPTNDIPHGLYNVLLHHFGGIQRARRAAGLPDPPQARTWTEAEVIAELRRLHAEGLTIRYRDLERHGREDVVGAIRVCIGSIVRARRLARIPEPPRAEFEQESWDEDRVIADILDLAERGEPLAYSKAPRNLVGAGTRYFGTWEEAIAAAGLDYDSIRLRRKPYDEDAMLARVRELARTQPEMTFGQLYDHADGQAIMRRFSSIEEAVEAAGVTGWPIRVLHAAYTEEETVRAIKARHRAGKSLTKTAIGASDSRLSLGIQRHFRTMEAVLTAAGLAEKLPDTIRWGREEVLKQLKRRRDAGLPLHASAIQEDIPSLYDAAIRFFGSYMTAAGRFGARPRQRTWTRETAITELRRLGKKHGVLKSTQVPKGLLSACTRYFGSWENTLLATGVTGLDHYPRGYWTRGRVIETLRERAGAGEPVTGKALGKSLLAAIWRNFGGLDSALAAANIERSG